MFVKQDCTSATHVCRQGLGGGHEQLLCSVQVYKALSAEEGNCQVGFLLIAIYFSSSDLPLFLDISNLLICLSQIYSVTAGGAHGLHLGGSAEGKDPKMQSSSGTTIVVSDEIFPWKGLRV